MMTLILLHMKHIVFELMALQKDHRFSFLKKEVILSLLQI
ncbi:unnamed protein product [Paramecium sonneborni]|uniref:Uncharacterized protein n=1 Tax=Paramecium sonneborni TaxID=65129 RepID=A0A8S1Q4D2_9CILI|nr:unnamed protein product [Paramecium sonneborni]